MQAGVALTMPDEGCAIVVSFPWWKWHLRHREVRRFSQITAMHCGAGAHPLQAGPESVFFATVQGPHSATCQLRDLGNSPVYPVVQNVVSGVVTMGVAPHPCED